VLLALLVGSIGGPLGGLAAAISGTTILDRVPSRTRGAVLAFSGGFILAVSFLALLVRGIEATEGWELAIVLAGLALGGGLRSLATKVIGAPHGQHGEAAYRRKQARKIALSLAVVNLLEGIPVGVGFAVGLQLGFLIGFIMIFENFTEGLSISTELAQGRQGALKMFLLTTAPTLTLGIGGAIGAYLGGISPILQAGLFGAAAGVMLYVVIDDIVYDAHRLGRGMITGLPLLAGVILGAVFSALG
jgi:ZIP family zinc transporter